MYEWVRQFSLPQNASDERVFATVVTTHAQEIARRFISSHSTEIVQQSEGLVEFVLAWTEGAASLETAWDLAFGRAQLALQSGQLDPVEVALGLALRLTETGCPGAWHATIAPQSKCFGGTLVHSVEEVQANVGGVLARIAMRTSDGQRVVGIRKTDGGSWILSGGKRLQSVGLTRPIYLLPKYAVPASGQDGQGFEGTHPVDAVDEAMVDAFAAGVQTIAEHATPYLGWIERVLRGIVICSQEASFRLVSGSGEQLPGIIHASHPLERMEIAEVLIHECAHQYFYMLERVGAIDDGTDRSLYWSPPIRSERPLSRILMAYHALANVRLFYECVRKSGTTDLLGYVETNQPEMDAAVASLDGPLRESLTLTALGRGLYEPLANRIHALREKVPT